MAGVVTADQATIVGKMSKWVESRFLKSGVTMTLTPSTIEKEIQAVNASYAQQHTILDQQIEAEDDKKFFWKIGTTKKIKRLEREQKELEKDKNSALEYFEYIKRSSRNYYFNRLMQGYRLLEESLKQKRGTVTYGEKFYFPKEVVFSIERTLFGAKQTDSPFEKLKDFGRLFYDNPKRGIIFQTYTKILHLVRIQFQQELLLFLMMMVLPLFMEPILMLIQVHRLYPQQAQRLLVW